MTSVLVDDGTPTFLRSPEKGGWIALGFRTFAIQRLKQTGQLYFLSWSQNWLDENKFPNQEIRLFPHDHMLGGERGVRRDPPFVEVTIEGPWDALYLKDAYLSASAFKDQAEADAAIHGWVSNQGDTPSYPLRMWLARAKP